MATQSGRSGLLEPSRTKWVVVAASFVVLFVVKGNVATYGNFITPIEADFGWSRTTISLTFTIYLLATAVASPVTGNLIDRYGAHRTIPAFILVVAVSMVALSALTSLAQLYVLYALIGLTVTGLALSHFSSIITKWFDSRTLFTTGVALSGASLGRLVFNPVAAEIILRFDWRTAYLAFGLLSLATVPLAYFLVKTPKVGERVDEAGEVVAERVEDTGASVSTALRTPSLWLLVFTFAICGFTTVGLMTTHLVPYLISIGFSGTIAAQGAGVLGGTTVFGLLAMGVVGDRYAARKRWLLSGIYFSRGVALLFLLVVASVLDVFIFATIYGFLTLCTIPLHAGITADRFGSKNLTTLLGIQYAGHQIGGATAAFAGGWIFDTFGSYRWAHLLGFGLLMVAPLLVLGDRFVASR